VVTVGILISRALPIIARWRSLYVMGERSASYKVLLLVADLERLAESIADRAVRAQLDQMIADWTEEAIRLEAAERAEIAETPRKRAVGY
jgi:hypothetical protein